MRIGSPLKNSLMSMMVFIIRLEYMNEGGFNFSRASLVGIAMVGHINSHINM